MLTRIIHGVTDLIRHLTVGEIIAVGTVAGVIVVAAFTGQAIFSPGKLSAMSSNNTPINGITAHAQLARDCGACHPAPWSGQTMADKCLSCHTDIAAQMQNPHALHSKVTEAGEGYNCVQSCHTEHRGPNAALTLLTEEHFTQGGGIFSLKAHQTRDDGFPFSCMDCHTGALDQFSEVTCLTCHRQRQPEFMATHIADFGSGCLQCHDGLDTYGSNFDHNATSFPLVGRHAQLPCSDCHKGATNIAMLQQTSPDCYSCHGSDDAHLGQIGHDCGKCHNAVAWKFISFDHSTTTYPLTGEHVSVDCTRCHPDNRFAGTPTDCNSCHAQDDPHAASDTDCQACHVTAKWQQISFDHTTTSYPLTGKHVAVECVSCHPNAVFSDTPQDCMSCHKTDDPHQGTATRCTTCHTPQDWHQVSFDHNTTTYPLIGKHTAVNCLDCHADSVFINAPTDCATCHQQDDPHTGSAPVCEICHTPQDWHMVDFDHSTTSFPLVGRHSSTNCTDCHIGNNFASTPTDCYSCHAKDDNHNGNLGKDCSLCHNTVDWTQITFDHQRSVFPLTGAHTTVACSLCHVNGVYAGTPTDCYACHAKDDAHIGTFGQGCSQCHTTSAWLPSTFNHNNTAFPLTGRHTSVACTSCHKNNVYAGTPTDCYSCHAQDDVHNGRNGTDCGRCHNTRSWGD